MILKINSFEVGVVKPNVTKHVAIWNEIHATDPSFTNANPTTRPTVSFPDGSHTVDHENDGSLNNLVWTRRFHVTPQPGAPAQPTMRFNIDGFEVNFIVKIVPRDPKTLVSGFAKRTTDASSKLGAIDASARVNHLGWPLAGPLLISSFRENALEIWGNGVTADTPPTLPVIDSDPGHFEIKWSEYGQPSWNTMGGVWEAGFRCRRVGTYAGPPDFATIQLGVESLGSNVANLFTIAIDSIAPDDTV